MLYISGSIRTHFMPKSFECAKTDPNLPYPFLILVPFLLSFLFLVPSPLTFSFPCPILLTFFLSLFHSPYLFLILVPFSLHFSYPCPILLTFFLSLSHSSYLFLEMTTSRVLSVLLLIYDPVLGAMPAAKYSYKGLQYSIRSMSLRIGL